MAATILLFLIFFNVTIIVLCEAVKHYFHIKIQKILLVVILGALTVLSVLIIPSNSMDLYRYYNRIAVYKIGGWDYFIQSLATDIQWLFNLELFLISKTSYDALAPVISCFIVFGAFYYIYFDYNNRFGKKPSKLIMSMGLFLAWLPYFQIIDNLRSPMAMAICAISIYKQFYCNRSFISQIIWYFIACFIHTQSVIIVLFVALYTLYPQIYRWRWFLLSGFILYPVVPVVLQKVPFFLIQTVAGKIVKYTSSETNISALFNEFTISRIAFLIFFAFAMEVAVKQIMDGAEHRFACWLHMYVIFALGCAPFAEVIRRFSYIMGFFSVMELSILLNGHSKKRLINKSVLWVCIIGMQFYAFLKMSRFSLQGINYSGIFEYLHIFIDF